MSKKSGVCNGEGSVCNQSGGFSVTHTGKAKIYGRHNVPPVGNGCPTLWDNHSQRVGQRLFAIHQRIDKDNQAAGEINLYPFGFPKSERIEYEHLQMRQLPILF